jgi:hypothetical protein
MVSCEADSRGSRSYRWFSCRDRVLQRGECCFTTSYSLRVVAQRDYRVGMVSQLRHQTDLNTVRLQRRDEEVARAVRRTECQRQTGSAFGLTIVVTADQLKIAKGELKSYARTG